MRQEKEEKKGDWNETNSREGGTGAGESEEEEEEEEESETRLLERRRLARLDRRLAFCISAREKSGGYLLVAIFKAGFER